MSRMLRIYIIDDPKTRVYVQSHAPDAERIAALLRQGCRLYYVDTTLPDEAFVEVATKRPEATLNALSSGEFGENERNAAHTAGWNEAVEASGQEMIAAANSNRPLLQAIRALKKPTEKGDARDHVDAANPNCRLCGRRLVDQSDLLVGRCNNEKACASRAASSETVATKERDGSAEEDDGAKAAARYLDYYYREGADARTTTGDRPVGDGVQKIALQLEQVADVQWLVADLQTHIERVRRKRRREEYPSIVLTMVQARDELKVLHRQAAEFRHRLEGAERLAEHRAAEIRLRCVERDQLKRDLGAVRRVVKVGQRVEARFPKPSWTPRSGVVEFVDESEVRVLWDRDVGNKHSVLTYTGTFSLAAFRQALADGRLQISAESER